MCCKESLWGWWVGKQFSWGAFISFNTNMNLSQNRLFLVSVKIFHFFR